MNQRCLSFKHKLIVALVVIMSCVALSVSMLLPAHFGIARAVGPNEGGTEQVETTASPLREYSTLSVEIPEGLTVYAAKTTPADLKNNITVIGGYSHYQGGELTYVELNPSEYVIKMGGETVNDNAVFYESADSLPAATILTIDSGSASVQTDEIAVAASVPTFTAINVALPEGVTAVEDVHTSDTLKDLLVVSGVNDEGETVIANKELYTLSVNPADISGLSSVTVIATYNGTLSSSAQTFNVIPATPQAISVAIRPGLRFMDGYYKYYSAADDIYYTAFVGGMSGEDVLKALQISVVYDNVSRVIDQDDLDRLGVDSLAVTNNTFGSGTQVVNVAVVFKSNASQSVSGSITIPFEELKAIKIQAEYSGSLSEFKSSTILDVSDFRVIPTYNNGTTATNALASGYTVDSMLTPTVENGDLNNGDKYSRNVRISLTDDKSVYDDVPFENITYVAPESVDAIIGTIADQTVLEDFDFSGLSVEIYYENQTFPTTMPLSEHKEWCEVTYYNSEGQVIASADGKVPSMQVYRVNITFTYGGSGSLRATLRNRRINLHRAIYGAPTMDTSAISYSDGCYKQIGGVDFDNVKAPLKVSVTELGGSSEAGGVYGADGGFTPIENSFAEYSRDGKITFKRGGTFTITVSLDNGEAGNYRWAPIAGQELEFERIYTVTVNKARLDVRLKNDKGEIDPETGLTIKYGELESTLASIGISSRTVGSNVIIQEEPEFVLYIYDGTTYTYADPSSMTENFRGVGIYKIIAVTSDENPAYASSKTYENYAVTLTIEEKEIAPSQLLQNRPYDRTDYASDLQSIINVNSSVFVYGDEALDPAPVAVASKATEIKHVGDYEITLTLNNSNYKWQAPSGSDYTVSGNIATAKFSITEATLSFSASVTDSTFTFGEPPSGFGTSYSVGSNFYAEVLPVKYYVAKDEGGVKVADTTQPRDIKDIATWDVDFYIAVYGTQTNKVAGDKDGDYNLPSAPVVFEITKKEIGQVSLSATSTTYNALQQTFTVVNFDGGYMNYTITGLSFDKNGNLTSNAVSATNEGADGRIGVTRAGEYTIVVSIDDNHAWNSADLADVDPDDGTLSFNYTVGQKEIGISWDTDRYEFSEGMAKSKPTPTAGGTEGGETLTLTTTAYENFNTSTGAGDGASANGFDTAGEYWVVVTAIDSADYKLPSVYYKQYTIGKATLAVPTADLLGSLLADGVKFAGNNFTAVYNGSAYGILNYLKYDKDGVTFEYAGKVTVTVTPIDGKTTLKDAAVYSFTIAPNTNYEWEGATADTDKSKAYPYTFTVEKLAVNVSWTIPSMTYIKGTVQAPTAVVVNVCSGDTVSVKLGIASSLAGAANGPEKVENAGTYYAVLASLDGASKDNYEINAEKGDYSRSFVIQKREIERPEIANGTITFGDAASGITFKKSSLWSVLDAAGVNATVSGSDWGTNSSRMATFTVATGAFEYTDAGNYTVKFTLADFDNYRWADGSTSDSFIVGAKDTEVNITVLRKTLTVPDWDARILQWSKAGDVAEPDIHFSEWSGAPAVNVTYGNVVINGNNISYNGSYTSAQSKDRDIYFVKYTIAGNSGDYVATENPLNYVWSDSNFKVESSTDSSLLGGGNGTNIEYSASEVSLTVHYRITSSVLYLTYNFESYTFGDNVDANGDVSSDFLSRIFTITDENEGSGDIDLLTAEAGKEDRFTLTVTFTDSEGTDVGGFTFRSGETSVTTTGSGLVGGLPWHADDYAVSVSWKFTADSDYQAVDGPATLKVKQLPISVNWSAEGDTSVTEDVENKEFSMTYDGETHTLSASVNNAPKLSGAAVDVPTLTVTNGNVSAANEDGYILSVKIDADSDGASDYIVDSSLNTAKLIINKRAVTVKADDYEHIYGDAVPTKASWKVTDGGFISEDAEAEADKYLKAVLSSGVTAFTAAGTTGLTINVEKKNDTSDARTFWNNYDLTVASAAAYTVSPRPITVDIVSGSMTSEYGDDLKLGAVKATSVPTELYTVSYTGDTNKAAIPSGENGDAVLFASYGLDGGTRIGVTSAAGDDYEIRFENLNTNYDIKFAQDNYTYSITPATLKVTVNVTIYYGENSPLDYDGNGNAYKMTNEYLYENTSGRNGHIYTVRGFKNGDDAAFYALTSAESITGSFGYEVAYTTWSLGGADIAFVPNDLVWGSYVFAADDVSGRLTVEKQPVTVTIKDKTAVYYGAYSELEYEIADVDSSYGLSASVTRYEASSAFAQDSDLFSLECAVEHDAQNRVTSDVNTSGYAIVGQSVSEALAYYSIEFVNEAGDGTQGKYTVNSATLENVPVETEKTLTYNDDDQTVQVSADSVDGSNVTIRYFMSTNGSETVNWGSAPGVTTVAPKVFTVGTYHVYYRITADNHAPITGKIAVTVEKGVNTFVDHFAVTNIEGAVIDGGTADFGAITKDAWTYGSYSKDSTSGFTAPKTSFDGSNDGVENVKDGNKLLVSLSYYSDADSRVPVDIFVDQALTNGGNIRVLLNNYFDTANKYSAGYYVITYTMPAFDGNYDAISFSRVFRVAKYELTVTPDSGTVQYGDPFEFLAGSGDNHGTSFGDFAYGEDRSVLGGMTFEWTTDYVVGDNANKSGLTIFIKDADAYNDTNYKFSFASSEFTVTPRKITVAIADKANSYDLHNPDRVGDTENYDTPTFGLKSGSFYNNETPFVLHTLANYSEEGKKTNDVGSYAIYAVWNEGDFENNYDVSFADCSIGSVTDEQVRDDDKDSYLGGGAGTFVISAAKVKVTYISPESYTYNGEAKEISVNTGAANIQFKSVYYLKKKDASGATSESKLAEGEKPVNAGTYRVEFVYDSDIQNYIVYTGDIEMTITPASLTVSIASVSIQYGTVLPSTFAKASTEARFNEGKGYVVTYRIPNNMYGVLSATDGYVTKEYLERKENIDGEKAKIGLDFVFESSYTASTAAGTPDLRVTVRSDSYFADNYTITIAGDGADLRVSRREIGIIVSGIDNDNGLATGEYTGSRSDQVALQQKNLSDKVTAALNGAESADKFFKFVDCDGADFADGDSWNGASGNNRSSLNVTLSIGGADNAGKYVMTPAHNNSNYEVKFYDKNGNASDESAYNARYEITKKQLTIYPSGSGSDAGKKSLSVIYGDELAYTPTYIGFVAGESYEVLAGLSGQTGGSMTAVTNYDKWVSGVTANDLTIAYTGVSGDELWFLNYEVNYESSTIKVTPRSVVASLDTSVRYIYNNNVVDANGGTHGDRVDAKVLFTNVENAPEGSKPTYTLAYAGTNSAPTKAGDYDVTVNLTGANYKFDSAGDGKFAFAIEKKVISLGWSPNASIHWDSQGMTDTLRTIDEFDKSIMSAEFYREYNQGASEEIVENGSDEKSYTVGADGKKISFTVYNTGDYRITLALHPNAEQNYVLSGNNLSGAEILLVLRVTSEYLEMKVTMQGWVYGSFDSDVNAPKVTIAGGDKNSVLYTYAKAGKEYDEIAQNIRENGFVDTDITTGNTLSDMVGIDNLGAFTSMSDDAGTYVVRAYYSPTGQSAFYVYRVTPKEVTAPHFETVENVNDTYTGSTLSLDITLDTAAVSVSVVGDSSYSMIAENAVMLRATYAGTYFVQYKLTSSNYVWAAKGDRTDIEWDEALGAFVATWEINKGTADILGVTLPDKITYGESFAPIATARFGAGTVLAYAVVGDGETLDDTSWAASADWRTSATQADTYWLRVTSLGSDNYVSSVSYVKFTIDPAELIAVPYGSMTYGESGEATYGYSLVGFVGADVGLSLRPSGTPTYRLSSGAIDDNLGFGEYALVLATSDGEVSGLTLKNYRIVAREGVFTVGKKSVSVAIEPRTSVYGEGLDLEVDHGVTVSGGVDLSKLGLTLSLIGVTGNNPNVGHYNIAVDCGNENYNVSVSTGIYNVTARRIHIGIIEVGGGSVGSVVGSNVTSLLDENNNEVIDRSLYGSLTYTYNDSRTVPSRIGTYTMTVGISNGNYELTGQVTYVFVIEKNVFSASNITVVPMVYTGAELVPTIEYHGEHNESDFEITYTDRLVEVGPYTITVTIKNFAENRWETTDGASRTFTFNITPAPCWVNTLEIKGWTYGNYNADVNSPKVSTTFDEDGNKDTYVFVYRGLDGRVIDGVPTQAGTYTVSVRMTTLSGNYYYDSDNASNIGFVMFTIAPAQCSVPSIVKIDSGADRNDIYTGSVLSALVDGFNPSLMDIDFDGVSNLSGGKLSVQAVNANVYTVKISLRDSGNYVWADGAELDENGNVVLKWEVQKRKVARPVGSDKKMVVNGSILEFIPDGFDASVMTIEDNRTGYGGTFQAKIGLVDPDNYEWDDGSTEAFEIEWRVVGASTVFAITISILSCAAGALAVVAVVQFLTFKKRKRMEAEAEALE